MSLRVNYTGWRDAVRAIVTHLIFLEERLERKAFISVTDYGAKGDGVTNDKAAIQAAINKLTTTKKTLVFPPGTYYIGTFGSAYEIIFDCSSLPDGVLFSGYGAIIKTETTAQNFYDIFYFRNKNRIVIEGFRFESTGYDLSVEWRGPNAIVFDSNQSTVTGTHTLQDVTGDGLVALLVVRGTNQSIRNIRLLNSGCSNTYYGISCQNNGDDLFADRFSFVNGRRAYFVYGVHRHDVNVDVFDSDTNIGAETCCLIKAYAYDISAIALKVTYKGAGTPNYTNVVAIEVDTPNSPKTIEHIDIDLTIESGLTSPELMRPIVIRVQASAVIETTTNSIFDDIRVKLNVGDYPYQPIAIDTVPNTEGHIYIDPQCRMAKNQGHFINMPGFAVIPKHGQEIRSYKGNLTTKTLTIPLANLDTNAFTLRISYHAHHSEAVLAAQKSTYREDLIVGYNAGSAPVTILSTTNILNIVTSAGLTPTYTASGENINITFAGVDYVNSDSTIRLVTEYVSVGA